jgi:hypothetical protein
MPGEGYSEPLCQLLDLWANLKLGKPGRMHDLKDFQRANPNLVCGAQPMIEGSTISLQINLIELGGPLSSSSIFRFPATDFFVGMRAELDQTLVQLAIDRTQLKVAPLNRSFNGCVRKGFSNGRLTGSIRVPVKPGAGQRRLACDQGSVSRILDAQS